MTTDNLWSAQYHSKKLIKHQDEMHRILQNTYPPYEITFNVTSIGEMYRLRYLLEEICAHSSLLDESLERHLNESKKSLWKRLLNK